MGPKKQRFEFEAWPVGTEVFIVYNKYKRGKVCDCCGRATVNEVNVVHPDSIAQIIVGRIDEPAQTPEVDYITKESRLVTDNTAYFLTRDEAQAECDRLNGKGGAECTK